MINHDDIMLMPTMKAAAGHHDQGMTSGASAMTVASSRNRGGKDSISIMMISDSSSNHDCLMIGRDEVMLMSMKEAAAGHHDRLIANLNRPMASVMANAARHHHDHVMVSHDELMKLIK